MILGVDFSEINDEFDGDFAGFIGDMGTHNYSELENKPQINGVTLEGDKTAGDLGLQSEIDDLDDIRDGAAAGATAVQPGDLSGYATENYVDNHHDSSKQDAISDLESIRTGAAAGATALQPAALNPYRTAPAQDLIDSTKIEEPENDGTSGQVLATDGAGGRYWKTPGGGTADHRQLSHRDTSDQHPMTSITGLSEALNSKLDAQNLVIGTQWVTGSPVSPTATKNFSEIAEAITTPSGALGAYRFTETPEEHLAYPFFNSDRYWDYGRDGSDYTRTVKAGDIFLIGVSSSDTYAIVEGGTYAYVVDYTGQKIMPYPGEMDYNDATNKPSINGVELNGNKTPEDFGIPTAYDDLDDKPSINGVTLSGNKTLANLGLAPALQSNVTYYISNSGSDETGDGTQDNPFATFGHALSLIPKNLNGHNVTLITEDEEYEVNGTAGISISQYISGRIYIQFKKIISGVNQIFNIQNNTAVVTLIGNEVCSTSTLVGDSSPCNIHILRSAVTIDSAITIKRTDTVSSGAGIYCDTDAACSGTWIGASIPDRDFHFVGAFRANIWANANSTFVNDPGRKCIISGGYHGLRSAGASIIATNTENSASIARSVSNSFIFENGTLYTS